MSRVRYHFIVPCQKGPDSLEDQKSLVYIAEKCFQGHTTADTQISLPRQLLSQSEHNAPYNAPSTVYDSSRHLLHGVVHANGFGHLLRVNGRESGSGRTTGAQMVDLWDALCQNLRARKVSVEDVSSKFGMELRVLNKIALGQTWYGQWGYKFGRGSFNISENRWNQAAEHISACSLNQLLHDFKGIDDRVLIIVSRYRLPVGGVAVYVRQLGALLYRLLYLRNYPDQARMFFDEKILQKAYDSLSTKEKETIDENFLYLLQNNGNMHIISEKHSDEQKSCTEERQENPSNGQKSINCHDSEELYPRKRQRLSRAVQKRKNKDLLVDSPSHGVIDASNVIDTTIEPLRYKAKLSREDAIEKARQLARALRVLIPASRKLTTGATTRGALDSAFRRIAGKAVPIPNYERPWWDFLDLILLWAYECIHGQFQNSQPRSLGIIVKRGEILEIDRQKIRSLCLFPESWPIPLQSTTVRRANQVAASKEGYRSFNPNADQNQKALHLNATTSKCIPYQSWKKSGKGIIGMVPFQTEMTMKQKQFRRSRNQQNAIDLFLAPLLSPYPQRDQFPKKRDETSPALVEPWMQLDPGSGIESEYLNPSTARNQITRDLHYLYSAILKVYVPDAAAKIGRNAALEFGEKPTFRQLKLRQLPAEVQVLKDTKHFLKIYSGDGEYKMNKEEEQDFNATRNHSMQVWCKISLPEQLAQPSSSTRKGRKFLPIDPPPILVTVPKTASIADFLSAASKVYRDVYHLTSDFTARTIVSGLKSQTNFGAGNRRRSTRSRLSAENTTVLSRGYNNLMQIEEILEYPKNCREIKTSKVSRNTEHEKKVVDRSIIPTVSVSGEGYNSCGVFLHAGGPEDWVVACPCGTYDDDGEAMVSCDKCKRWFHCRCVGYAEDAAEPYICNSCMRTFSNQNALRH